MALITFQRTTPFLSMMNVPRVARPRASSKTPYDLATAPCSPDSVMGLPCWSLSSKSGAMSPTSTAIHGSFPPTAQRPVMDITGRMNDCARTSSPREDRAGRHRVCHDRANAWAVVLPGTSASRFGGDQARGRPVLSRADRGRLRQPGGRRRLADLARLDMAFAACLRSQQQDVPAVGERRLRIDKRVDEVSVPVPPPQQDPVHYVVVVLVDQFDVLACRYRIA